MAIVSLIIGILAFLGMFVGLIPCFGGLNWINLPIAVLGIILGAVAYSRNANDSTAKIALVLNIMAFVIGAIRLVMGGGII